MAKFLARYEVFKKVLPIQGCVVECGVLYGNGLFTFAKFSSIMDPVNHTRKIIGFDTFEGFPSVHEIDTKGSSPLAKVGGMKGSPQQEIQKAVELYDLNRPLSHIPKVELVAGDICKTAKSYVDSHPHLVVALLYLDLDLYAPTKAALEAFLPRMPKGGVIVFDELNAEKFPGETQAVHEVMGLNKCKIERFPWDSYFSYMVVE